MKKNEQDIDFFGDGMRIFLSYIERQYKKNEDYLPHPIIRAFEQGVSNIDKIEIGEHVVGVSGNSVEDSVYSPYAVVLKKTTQGIEVVEIRNMQVDKELPLDIMTIIFRIQIKLDRIEGDDVSPAEMVEVLNSVFSGDLFMLLGDRWKEARDIFKEKIEKGKINFPLDNSLIKELETIREGTDWKDYSNRLRSIIGSCISDKMPHEKKIIITSPLDSEIPKYKVFSSAIEFLLGASSDYLNLLNRKK